MNCFDVFFCFERMLKLEAFEKVNSDLLIINCDDLFAIWSETISNTSINFRYWFVGDIVKNNDLSAEIAGNNLKHLGIGVPIYFLERSSVLIMVSLF